MTSQHLMPGRGPLNPHLYPACLFSAAMIPVPFCLCACSFVAFLHRYPWLRQASRHDGLLEGRMASHFQEKQPQLPAYLSSEVRRSLHITPNHTPTPQMPSLLGIRQLHTSILPEHLLASEATIGVPSLCPLQTLLHLSVWILYSIFPFSVILPVSYMERKGQTTPIFAALSSNIFISFSLPPSGLPSEAMHSKVLLSRMQALVLLELKYNSQWS